MIKVSNELKLLEIDGKAESGLDCPKMVVRSHWNRDSLIVLLVNGVSYTVSASDILAAIKNATNSNSYQ